MLKKVLIGIVGAVALFSVFVATRPSEFKITRSAVINAAPSVIFAEVNNLQRWNNWSPWAKMDPNMKQGFEGPASGEGAVSTWVGNKEVGEGRSTIIKSQEPELIQIKLEFFKPWQATNMTEFIFTPQGQGALVSWSMSGANNFMAKAFCLFMDMDKMVGGDFEKGLAQLQAITETKK